MDLSERRGAGRMRHPWETARAEAIADLIRHLEPGAARVLDVGCGDGFLAGELHRRLHFDEVVAVDHHLTDALIEELETPGVHLGSSLDEVPLEASDLVLLLDVLEHVEDPVLFLRRDVLPRLSPHGQLLITVPAFQSLFSRHDRALGHYRRYRRASIARLVESAELEVTSSGYLFASLLVPRALGVWAERMRARLGGRARPGAPAPATPEGIGDWRGSGGLTRFIHRALCADNRLCLLASRSGITVPGLSVWLTCKRRR